MFGIGFQELVIIFLVFFLLFGAKSLPDLARGLGQAVRLFKKEINDLKSTIEESAKDDSSSQKKVASKKEIGSNV